MINSSPLNDWRELQDQVAQILRECGLQVEIEKDVRTVRGTVNIDVHAEDKPSEPTTIYLCECKYWQSAVPKSVVHAFRTVVADYGANWGFIVSSGGFQQGAYEAAANSNIRLLSWDEFQELFTDRWIENYMVPRMREEADPLVEYTEPINSRIFRKADALDKRSQEQFIELRKKYANLAFLALHLYIRPLFLGTSRPALPLRNAVAKSDLHGANTFPDDLLDAASLRDFLDVLCAHVREGVAAFDQLFGERA